MDKDTILQLREKFRDDFEINDYCIGQARIEEFFREFLNEPAPEYYKAPTPSPAHLSKFTDLATESLIPKLKEAFESESPVFRFIK